MVARRVHVERIVGGGRGLAHVEGVAWFVSGALPGETVLAAVERRRAGTVQARAVALVDAPHPARCDDPCPHAEECGGCDWPHVEPLQGAALKAEVAAGAARPVPGLATRLQAAPSVPSPLAYRLRATLHWDAEQGSLGFYARGTHRVVDIPHCRLLSPGLAELRQPLARALRTRGCPTTDVECLESTAGDSVVVALRPPVRRGPLPPARAIPRPEEVEYAALDGLHRIDASGLLLEGWGTTRVHMDTAGGIEVPIGAFFQVNRHLVGWLARRLTELTSATAGPLYDLHAGVGFLAAACSESMRRPCFLAETNTLAARAAGRNVRHGTVSHRPAADAVADWQPLPREAVALVDPPRSGLGTELTTRLVSWRPRWLISLGCDPATWARDHVRILDAGYTLTSLELVDLFPSTHHVEILAMLELQ